MFNIQKISQRYDQREDRIELAIENEHGHVVRLWLTQRLACRMLQVLNKWLPEIREAEKNNTQTSPTETPRAEPANNQMQASSTGDSAAKLANQQIAVDFNLAAEEGLLSTIDMTRNAQDYQLTFKWGVTGVATINMGLAQMENYLAGMAQLFQNANWNMGVFAEATTHALKPKQPSFEDFPEEASHAAYTLH
jgi:hypothetical protein